MRPAAPTTCLLCSRPIHILAPSAELDTQSDSSEIDEIDSIQLPTCNHTFHWSCWATYESQNPSGRAACPAPDCGVSSVLKRLPPQTLASF
ncbi:hypothetical protein RSAG8_10362, partial [Rhizoctonia solani AG-8 WAC10335]